MGPLISYIAVDARLRWVVPIQASGFKRKVRKNIL